MEVPLGVLPGGSGTRRIPELVGRGRASEIVLGGGDVDAATAEPWGWLNRAVPATDLADVVDALARRVAAWPPGAVAMAKQSVLNASSSTGDAGPNEEQYPFRRLLRTPAAQERMRAFLDAGGQTARAERRVADLTAGLP